MKIRVATWNIWKRGGRWEQRHSAICQALLEVAPDIVTIQQAWRVSGRDQTQDIAAELGLDHVVCSPYGPPATSNELEVNLAVLSRWKLATPERADLPSNDARAMGRGMLGVVVEHPGGRVPVVTTHLSSRPTGCRRSPRLPR